MKYLSLLFIALAFYQCSFPVADIFDDPDIIQPQDTTISAPVVVVDTCHQLVTATDTAFVTIGTHFFNGVLGYDWRLDQFGFSSSNLVELLEHYWPQYSYTYYEGNGSVMVFVDGTNNADQFEGKIWTVDAIGQRAVLTSSSETMFLYGALTFDEAMYEADHRINVEQFGYWNSNWTEEQNNAYARKQLHADICKRGEERADFRFASTPVLQSIRDSFKLFEWDLVQPFVNQTGSPEKA
jgi:hypothetical protein